MIREIKKSDYKKINELVIKLPEWFNGTGPEHIAIDLNFHFGLVEENEEKEILGFITYFIYEAVGTIGWIGINPKYHRTGIGTKLFEAFQEEMQKNNIRTLQVYTLGDSVEYKPYEYTRNFYYKIGFKEYRRIKTNNPGCPEELYLRKEI